MKKKIKKLIPEFVVAIVVVVVVIVLADIVVVAVEIIIVLTIIKENKMISKYIKWSLSLLIFICIYGD